MFKKKWDIFSYGKRIIRRKINNFKTEIVDPTENLKSLFSNNNIDFENGNNLISLLNDKIYKKLLDIFKNILQMRNSSESEDYIISPVKDKNEKFFDSRISEKIHDGDSNGAYNIAMKGLMILKMNNDNAESKKFFISNQEWFKFMQDGSFRK